MKNEYMGEELKKYGRQEYEAKAADFWAAMIFIASIFTVLGYLVGKYT